MQQYRVEFFENYTSGNNQHKLKYCHHDFSENLTIDDDYLAAQSTTIEIGPTDKVKNGQLIRILRDNDDYFFGIVVDAAPGERTTAVSFRPFISLFDADILFDTSDQMQNTQEFSLENVLKKYIEANYVNNSDSLQNYPIDVTVPTTDHTIKWGMNIKSDIEGAKRAIIGLYSVLIVNALKNFGVAINVTPDFATGRITLRIGKIDGEKYIDADLDNAEIKTLKVNDRPNGINKLIVYNADNFNQTPYIFYAHTDHSWDLENTDRIVPVAFEMRTATPEYDLDVEDPFLVAAANVAYDELSGLTWDNLIELECAPNDPLINPTAMSIGQLVSIFYNGSTYTSILTGKSVTFETVTLSFGSERIKFTKKRTSK